MFNVDSKTRTYAYGHARQTFIITKSSEHKLKYVYYMDVIVNIRAFQFQMFMSAHYAGEDMVAKFADGEPWKRVFGPVFMYVNSVPKEVDWHWLWEDAKEQVYYFTFCLSSPLCVYLSS